MPKVSTKRQRFAEEYARDMNAAQAAIRAGYSPRSARQVGNRLLKAKEVQQVIQKLQTEVTEVTTMDRRRILAELSILASVDIGDFLDFSGAKLKLKPMSQIPQHAYRAISSLEVTKQGFKLKLRDKMNALKMLAQHIGLLREVHEVKVETTGKDGGPIQTEVKHGFDGDLTPYIDIVRRVAENPPSPVHLARKNVEGRSPVVNRPDC